MNEKSGWTFPSEIIYCILRLIIGLLFFCHGAQKILGWFANPEHPAEPLDTMMTLGGWTQLVCGAPVAIGLLTRPAAFLASGTMAVAYFMFHAKGGFFPIVNHGESAVIYCWVFLFIFCYGAGSFGVDQLIKRRRATGGTGR
jgi:putative oxidoreductase